MSATLDLYAALRSAYFDGHRYSNNESSREIADASMGIVTTQAVLPSLARISFVVDNADTETIMA